MCNKDFSDELKSTIKFLLRINDNISNKRDGLTNLQDIANNAKLILLLKILFA